MIIEQDIRGERVILSQYYEKDVSEEYLSWLSDKEINRFLEARFTEYSEALAKEYVNSCIKSPNTYFLKIVSKKMISSVRAPSPTMKTTGLLKLG